MRCFYFPIDAYERNQSVPKKNVFGFFFVFLLLPLSVSVPAVVKARVSDFMPLCVCRLAGNFDDYEKAKREECEASKNKNEKKNHLRYFSREQKAVN